MKKGEWMYVAGGQMRLMSCNIYSTSPLKVTHHWVADGTGRVWCGECGVPRHPDYEQREAARDQRLNDLKAKRFV